MQKNYSLNNLSPRVFHGTLVLLIVVMVALKFEALHLPFYWDEAWVYMPAIRTMAEAGPSIMPGSIDANLYTGHPLLFYFMASSWINMWGYSLPIVHMFPLIISLALIISIYFITHHFTKSYYTAIVAVLLNMVQPIFLTQSTFLLIEIWLGLLFLWSFYFYFNRQTIGFGITLILALWSKESAFTLIPAFGLTAVYELLSKQITSKQFITKALSLIGCFAIGFSFFIIQKYKLGWLFFPRHANWINIDESLGKLKGAITTIFVSQGRTYFYAFAIVIYTILHIKLKKRFTQVQLNFFIATGIFTLGFIAFAIINFMSARYLFGALPLLLIVLSFCYGMIENQLQQVAILLTIVIMGIINIDRSYNYKNWSDTDLNYTRMLKAQVDFVNYLKEEPPTEKVFAPFLMYSNLYNPYSGFIEKPFVHLTDIAKDTSTVYFINVPNESDEYLQELIKNNKVSLVKRIENKHAWIELYKK
jgi:hypothetical protein